MNSKRELHKIELLKLKGHKGHTYVMKPGLPKPLLHSTMSGIENSTTWLMTSYKVR